MERSGDLVGIFEPQGQEGVKIVFTDLTQRPPEGTAHTYGVYDDQGAGEFLETPVESLQELRGLNYIYAGDHKTLNPEDLDGYLNYLQESIKPTTRLTRAEAEARRMELAKSKGRLDQYLLEKLTRQLSKTMDPRDARAQAQKALRQQQTQGTAQGAEKTDQPPPPPPIVTGKLF